jgi:hypothetical protein
MKDKNVFEKDPFKRARMLELDMLEEDVLEKDLFKEKRTFKEWAIIIRDLVQGIIGMAMLLWIGSAFLKDCSSGRPSYYCDRGVNCSAWQPRDENGRFK